MGVRDTACITILTFYIHILTACDLSGFLAIMFKPFGFIAPTDF